MSDDRRERILLRLKALLDAAAATNGDTFKSWRNRSEFDDSQATTDLPCYAMLDGIETKHVGSNEIAGKRGPHIMLLQPQIFYVPVPTENQLNELMGEKISEHRSKLLKAIMLDGTLADLLGDNGFIEYRGMETDMQTGAEVKGQIRLDLAFAYVLNFHKL